MAALLCQEHVAAVTNGYQATADRPRERLRTLGARALARRELVALLVGSGGVHGSAPAVADSILEVAEGSLRRLAALYVAALERVAGVGVATACRVLAALELGRRSAAEGPAERERIQGPGDVYIRLGPRLREVILAHNHPSGDPSPSPDDWAVTRQIAEAGRTLGIPVLDHVILGDGRFTSLAEEGGHRWRLPAAPG